MSRKKTTIEFIKDAKKAHGKLYDYSKTNYTKATEKVEIICKKHGSFYQLPNNHLKGNKCKKCLTTKKTLTNKEFIEKASKVHQNSYSYSKVNYIKSDVKVIITCIEHGDFLQKATSHLQGHGCPNCGTEAIGKYHKENAVAWSYSNWEKRGKKSKNFDSFKIYIIRCWNENEEFYKIGKTYRTINNRFRTKTFLPYNYEIIKVIEGSAEEVSSIEKELQKQHKEYKCVPKIMFNGVQECFKKIDINE